MLHLLITYFASSNNPSSRTKSEVMAVLGICLGNVLYICVVKLNDLHYI